MTPQTIQLVGMVVFALLAAALGAGFASFLAVVAERVPAGESINGRSRCPHCANQVAGYDNIPLVSWVVLRGRCRQCRAPIPKWYFAVECVGAVCGLLAFGLGVLARSF